MSDDPLMRDAMALVNVLGSDFAGVAEFLNSTDCQEHHKLMIRLAALVRLAVRAEDWDHLLRLADEMGGLP